MAVLLASTRYHKPLGNLLRGYLEIFCSQPLQGLFLLRNEIYGYYSWLFFTTSRHLVPRSSRWKDLAAFLRSARRSAAFLQRIFYRREFFLNYFKYNVYICTEAQQFSRNEEIVWRGCSWISKFSRASMVTCANVPGQKRREEEEGMAAGWKTCCLRLGCITTLLCTFLPRAKCIFEIGNMCCQYVPEGRMNLSCCLELLHPRGHNRPRP